MRQHLDHPAGEVQDQQQAALRQALKAVLPTGRDQELQPRPVPLARSPRKPAYRHGQRRWRGREVAYGHHDLGSARLPDRCPRTLPIQVAGEPTDSLLRHGVRQEEFIEGAGVRPHRPVFAHSTLFRGLHEATSSQSHCTVGEIAGNRPFSPGPRYPARLRAQLAN